MGPYTIESCMRKNDIEDCKEKSNNGLVWNEEPPLEYSFSTGYGIKLNHNAIAVMTTTVA